MRLSHIIINQANAAIGIHSESARQSMHSSPGDLQIRQQQGDMSIHSTPAELDIDSTKAWAALGKGGNLAWNKAIYSQMDSIFLQHLSKQVRDGKRMADITNPNNAFADLARAGRFWHNPVNYQASKPGYDNVRLEYTPTDVSTTIQPTDVSVAYTPFKPVVETQPGNVEIYLRQKNFIAIDVSPASN